MLVFEFLGYKVVEFVHVSLIFEKVNETCQLAGSSGLQKFLLQFLLIYELKKLLVFQNQFLLCRSALLSS